MENEMISSFLNSTIALLAAIGVFLSGIASILKAIPKSFWDKFKSPPNPKKSKSNLEDNTVIKFNKWFLSSGIFLSVCGIILFTLMSIYAQEVPLN
jgi:hypothetical protein